MFRRETVPVPSVQYSVAVPLLDENWEGLRLDAGGVDVGWSDASVQNHFLSKAQHTDNKLAAP